MSTVATQLMSWEEFLQLPDAENAEHYELHDGEFAVMPPARPIHICIQNSLVKWLIEAAMGEGSAAQEFPYRPAKNLQFWYADVAYLPNADWKAMRTDDYPVYAPPLIIEVLSPSNRGPKIQRQQLAAFSCGTQEFWVIDAVRQTIEVSMPGRETHVYESGENIPVSAIPGALFPVDLLFQ